MPEGTKIERIEDLKPGDVLVLDLDKTLLLPAWARCIEADVDLVLHQDSEGYLCVPCSCCKKPDGFWVKLLADAGVMQFFTLKSRSGGEVCPAAEVASFGAKIERRPLRLGDEVLLFKEILGAPAEVWLTVVEVYPDFYGLGYADKRGGATYCLLADDLIEGEAEGAIAVIRRDRDESVLAAEAWANKPQAVLGSMAERAALDAATAAYRELKAAVDAGLPTGPQPISEAAGRSDPYAGQFNATTARANAEYNKALSVAETDWDATDGLGDGSPLAIGYTRLPVEDIAAGATIYVSGGWLNIRTPDGRVITSKQPIMLMPSPDPKPTVPDDVQVGPVDFLALNKEFSSK